MAELKFDREATLERLFKPVALPEKSPLHEVAENITAQRELMINALTHIANTSNNYESKYAKAALAELAQLVERNLAKV